MKFISMFAAAVLSLTGSTNSTSTQPVPEHCVTLIHTLALGSSGDEVIQLQKFLGVKTSGYFGALTQSALLKWQLGAHIVVSAKTAGAGTTGPRTRAALKCTVAAVEPITKISVSINPPTAAPSTTTIPTTTPPLPQLISSPSLGGGGGGASNSGVGAASQCAPFMQEQPSAASCTTGAWFIGRDEAGCAQEWICDDPNATQ